MKKKFILICCLMLFSFAKQSMCVAETRAEKLLKKHPEFVSIEGIWGNKLGNDYRIKLTKGRILEFQFIDSRNGGGKYAGLKEIGEFSVTGQVDYIDGVDHSWKDTYGSHVRFQDLSQLLGIKIENMIDCIDNYDKILEYVQMLAREQYLAGYEASFNRAEIRWKNPDNLKKFPHHFVLSDERNAMIAVWRIYGYPERLWHGINEVEHENRSYKNMFGENWCINNYGENWREKLNADLPKIRKSLGLEN